MSPWQGRARKLLRLTAILGTAAFLISTILPWLAEQGYAGRVVQQTHRQGRDATALFYTEIEDPEVRD